ncbi:hypothetical protein D3C81_1698940 [compost metagenome]
MSKYPGIMPAFKYIVITTRMYIGFRSGVAFLVSPYASSEQPSNVRSVPITVRPIEMMSGFIISFLLNTST